MPLINNLFTNLYFFLSLIIWILDAQSYYYCKYFTAGGSTDNTQFGLLERMYICMYLCVYFHLDVFHFYFNTMLVWLSMTLVLLTIKIVLNEQISLL